MATKRFEFQCKFKGLDIELVIATDDFMELDAIIDKTLGMLKDIGAFQPYVFFQQEACTEPGKVVYKEEGKILFEPQTEG